MAAKDQFDVVFQPDYQPPDVGEWEASDEVLPNSSEGYFLRANTGPRWMLGGVMSRPFVTTLQSKGVCAISSIESSKEYAPGLLGKYMAFREVDHCLCVQEGTLVVALNGLGEYVFREGETVVVPAGQAFALRFESKYVRVWSFTDGDGIEMLVQKLGREFGGVVLPDVAPDWDSSRTGSVAAELKVDIDL